MIVAIPCDGTSAVMDIHGHIALVYQPASVDLLRDRLHLICKLHIFTKRFFEKILKGSWTVIGAQSH